MLSWSSNFLVVLKLKSRCSFTLESAWTMKLIRSSSLGAADFFVFLHLLFFLNTSTSNLIFLPSSPTPLQLLFSFPSFNFVLSFLEWSIDALQPVARAYKCLSHLLSHFAISFCHLICGLICCLIWCFIFPSHLLSHFTISFVVSFAVSSDVSFSRLIWCLFTRVMSYAARKVREKERNLLIFVEKTCTLQRKAVTLSCFSAQPLQGAPKAP